jgi:DNA repair protein RadC
MTGMIDAAARALGVTLHDHIIIGKSCELSFRAEGYL